MLIRGTPFTSARKSTLQTAFSYVIVIGPANIFHFVLRVRYLIRIVGLAVESSWLSTSTC